MIKINDCKDRCFAKLKGGCSALKTVPAKCGNKCPFYKPTGCEDWIRIEYKGNMWLVSPEEYFKE